MELIQEWLSKSPLVSFTILLLVIFTIPPWFEKLRLPGLVGLLVAGVVLGGSGLNLISSDSETMQLLSDIGKIYLMFVAGLEIDLQQFRQNKNRSLAFGFFTFAIPLIIGNLVGLTFGFGVNASILIGSLFASHTLLGYPIVQRLGLVDAESVIVTIGATIFTDISALLVLAICVSINAGEFSVYSLSIQLGFLAIYSALILFGFAKAGKEYFRRTGDEESNQFLFILLVVFIASVGAQIINIDKIVGAFLAGLAINEVVGKSPVKEKVEFVGSVLFIPFFFIDMGLLLDLPAFAESLTTSLALTVAIVLGLIVSKFLAALLTKLLYRYNWNETMVMWSLSLPQVAATLAAALVGYQVGLLTKAVFNGVIVLMLVTAILGPMLTAKFAPKLPQTQPKLDNKKSLLWWEERQEGTEIITNEFNVIVPVSNPQTERDLIEMAALVASHELGKIVPLSVAENRGNLDDPELVISLQHCRQLLKKATEISAEFNVEAKPILRIADDVAQGITLLAREEDASLIVMGWSEEIDLRSRLFGNVIDRVLWASHCPVAVLRLLKEPIDLTQILVPVKNLTPQTVRTVRFAQLLADTNQGKVTVLHVCPPQTSLAQITAIETEFSKFLNTEVKVISHDNVPTVILREAETTDAIVMRSQRRRTAVGLAVSDVTTEVINSLQTSLILFGEPHSNLGKGD
ncbi:MAG: cation:proton antiporter [Oscillatoria sp. PMC 1051.18]|nr:cation:proton antiporter [Oscillatoria sp. PMC 1050.18]MEC5031944.1 cation:proton antiporter [Oscillatoria sp. PMC 1051.18]